MQKKSYSSCKMFLELFQVLCYILKHIFYKSCDIYKTRINLETTTNVKMAIGWKFLRERECKHCREKSYLESQDCNYFCLGKCFWWFKFFCTISKALAAKHDENYFKLQRSGKIIKNICLINGKMSTEMTSHKIKIYET